MDPLADGHYPGEWIDVGRPPPLRHDRGRQGHGGGDPGPRSGPHRAADRPRLPARRAAARPAARSPASTVGVQVALTITLRLPQPGGAALRRPTGSRSCRPPGRTRRSPSRAVVDTGTRTGDGRRSSEPGRALTTLSEPAARAGGGLPGRPSRCPTIPGRYRLASVSPRPTARRPSRTFRTDRGRGPRAVRRRGRRCPRPPRSPPARRSSIKLAVAQHRHASTGGRRAPDADDPTARGAGRQTLLVLTWRSQHGTEQPAAQVPIELAPGSGPGTLKLDLVAPDTAGAWTLVSDVVNVERVRCLDRPAACRRRWPVLVDPQGLAAEP